MGHHVFSCCSLLLSTTVLNDNSQGILTTMIVLLLGHLYIMIQKGGQVTKPIIVMKYVNYLLYIFK